MISSEDVNNLYSLKELELDSNPNLQKNGNILKGSYGYISQVLI